MLSGNLSLHDIRDVEAFCAEIIGRFNLSHHEREDLLAYLVEECWILSRQHRPGPYSFASRASHILRRRVADLERQRFRTRWVFADRVYERPRPEFVPLDDRPELADHTQSVDASPYSDAFARRLLRERSSQPARGDRSVGAAKDEIAA